MIFFLHFSWVIKKTLVQTTVLQYFKLYYFKNNTQRINLATEHHVQHIWDYLLCYWRKLSNRWWASWALGDTNAFPSTVLFMMFIPLFGYPRTRPNRNFRTFLSYSIWSWQLTNQMFDENTSKILYWQLYESSWTVTGNCPGFCGISPAAPVNRLECLVSFDHIFFLYVLVLLFITIGGKLLGKILSKNIWL